VRAVKRVLATETTAFTLVASSTNPAELERPFWNALLVMVKAEEVRFKPRMKGSWIVTKRTSHEEDKKKAEKRTGRAYLAGGGGDTVSCEDGGSQDLKGGQSRPHTDSQLGDSDHG